MIELGSWYIHASLETALAYNMHMFLQVVDHRRPEFLTNWCESQLRFTGWRAVRCRNGVL